MEACDVHVYKLTRLDESYRHFLTFSRMLEVLDRQDVLDLHKIVMERVSHGFFDVLQFGLTHDDLLSNDVHKDFVDRMYACLTSQRIEKMSPLVLVPMY
uniref:Uncharacterized protein n=1 Tax=Tanacetum cinerariifolium TaxID=118510 RepID=A0A6L2KE96_TANCI|nr:hypothetical protein [Tanacetum cinerariifolium]